MALEIRHGRDGKPIPHWFGRYIPLAYRRERNRRGIWRCSGDSGKPAAQAKRGRPERGADRGGAAVRVVWALFGLCLGFWPTQTVKARRTRNPRNTSGRDYY